MAPSDYPHAVPSAWLFDDDWCDKAYEEVSSLKQKYSHLLDEAYLDICKAYSENNEVSGLATLSHKKLLNFLASTREDTRLLSKEKCYKRVMSIKGLSTRRDLVSRHASWNYSTNQAQSRNWRDEIYDQILVLRNLYSLELDKCLMGADKMQNKTLDDDKKEQRHSFIEKSLQFLAYSRADIVFLSESYCRKWLADIKLFTVDMPTAKEELVDCITNWRDRAYEKLQYKAHWFRSQVYDVYLTWKVIWSKIPHLADQFRDLEQRVKDALNFYDMPRARMSSLVSTNDYFSLWGSTIKDVEEAIHLIKGLLKTDEPNWDCKADKMIPKYISSLVQPKVYV